MEFSVHHETTYRYARQVSESYTAVVLQPRTNVRQYCTRYQLDVTPAARVFSYLDRFGNDVQHFSIVPDHGELQIVARSSVVTVAGTIDVPRGVDAERLAADAATGALYDFRHASPYVAIDAAVEDLARAVEAPADDLAAYFLAAARLVHREFAYRPGTTTVRTTIQDVLDARSGVCQDFAHLLIALTRARGIPARYASGYVFSGTDAVLGAEASHAWVEAYLPPFGWVGYDPTNDRLVDDSFVLVAVGRDYGDVSPTRGIYRGDGTGSLTVNVAVQATSDQ